jgi:hypothetical protein
MLLNVAFPMQSLLIYQNQCKIIKSENSIMKNKQIFLYFRYKENKMQGLNTNFTGRPYCNKKDTSQVGQQEANT